VRESQEFWGAFWSPFYGALLWVSISYKESSVFVDYSYERRVKQARRCLYIRPHYHGRPTWVCATSVNLTGIITMLGGKYMGDGCVLNFTIWTSKPQIVLCWCKLLALCNHFCKIKREAKDRWLRRGTAHARKRCRAFWRKCVYGKDGAPIIPSKAHHAGNYTPNGHKNL
jgi:hypothetical protein